MANEPVGLASPPACCPIHLIHGELLSFVCARDSTAAVWWSWKSDQSVPGGRRLALSKANRGLGTYTKALATTNLLPCSGRAFGPDDWDPGFPILVLVAEEASRKS
jgi:hypothetical protein